MWLNIDNFVQMTPSQILVLTSSPSFKRVWDLVMMRFWHSFTTSLGPEVSKPKSHTYILEQKKLVIHSRVSAFGGDIFLWIFTWEKKKFHTESFLHIFIEYIYLESFWSSHSRQEYERKWNLGEMISMTRILNLQLIKSLYKIVFKIFLINKVYLWKKNKCYFDFHLISLS